MRSGDCAAHLERLRLHSESELDMAKTRLTRGKLLAAAAPLAAVPLVGKLAFDGDATAAGHDHSSHDRSRTLATHEGGDPRPCGDDRRRGACGRRPQRSRRAPLSASRAPVRAGPSPRVHAHRDRRRARDRAGHLLPGVGLQRDGARPRHPRDRGRSSARELRERRLASAHDPLPRHPSDEHGRRLRGRRAGRALHATSSRRSRRASTSTTATRRR